MLLGLRQASKGKARQGSVPRGECLSVSGDVAPEHGTVTGNSSIHQTPKESSQALLTGIRCCILLPPESTLDIPPSPDPATIGRTWRSIWREAGEKGAQTWPGAGCGSRGPSTGCAQPVPALVLCPGSQGPGQWNQQHWPPSPQAPGDQSGDCWCQAGRRKVCLLQESGSSVNDKVITLLQHTLIDRDLIDC